MKKTFLLIFTICLLASKCYALPAFPGAVGFGSDNVGGRGGTVYKVTNLNDSGAGSLRAACEASGARYVEFTVSGTINLASDILIVNPYITIAGQTSPGGIAVASATFFVSTHDAIITHMRFRAGTARTNYARDESGNILYYLTETVMGNGFADNRVTKDDCIGTIVPASYDDDYVNPCVLNTGADPEFIHGFVIQGQGYGGYSAHDIIVDHCSISWGVDETAAFTGGTMDCTMSWCMIYEGLMRGGHSGGEHSKGLMLSGKPGNYDSRITIHHNFVSSSSDRIPLMYSGNDYPSETTRIDGFNNISYNWYHGLAPWIEERPLVNWVKNYAKMGPRTTGYYELTYLPKPTDASPSALVYVDDNRGVVRDSEDDPDWAVGYSYANQLIDSGWQKTEAYSPNTFSTAQEMTSTYITAILADVGATKPVRDTADTAEIGYYVNGTAPNYNVSRDAGNLVLNMQYPTGYPTFDDPSAPTDSDNDGMSDAWENSTFGNLDQTATGDFDSDGYENIEEYFFYLGGYSESAPSVHHSIFSAGRSFTSGGKSVVGISE